MRHTCYAAILAVLFAAYAIPQRAGGGAARGIQGGMASSVTKPFPVLPHPRASLPPPQFPRLLPSPCPAPFFPCPLVQRFDRQRFFPAQNAASFQVWSGGAPYPYYGGPPEMGFGPPPENFWPPFYPEMFVQQKIPPRREAPPAPAANEVGLDRTRVARLGEPAAPAEKPADKPPDQPKQAEPPLAPANHPRMVTLANGSAYTIVSYWVDGSMFHFVTTHGDHVQVSLVQVERLYPRTEDDAKVAASLPAAGR